MKRAKFESEVEEYLALKSKKTAQIYSSALTKFLTYYQSKHGKDKGFAHFLDRIFEEFKKPMREQRRIYSAWELNLTVRNKIFHHA